MSLLALWAGSECTKIAHRRSLAIFTAHEGIAGNSAARTNFTHFLRRRNRGSLAIFFAEEITHLGVSKNRAIFQGAVKIAAAAAENRAIFGALRAGWVTLPCQTLAQSWVCYSPSLFSRGPSAISLKSRVFSAELSVT